MSKLVMFRINGGRYAWHGVASIMTVLFCMFMLRTAFAADCKMAAGITDVFIFFRGDADRFKGSLEPIIREESRAIIKEQENISNTQFNFINKMKFVVDIVAVEEPDGVMVAGVSLIGDPMMAPLAIPRVVHGSSEEFMSALNDRVRGMTREALCDPLNFRKSPVSAEATK